MKTVRLCRVVCGCSLLLASPGAAQTFFAEVTEQAMSGVLFSGRSVAFGDYDNDGWPDLFLAWETRLGLWHNEGNGRLAMGNAALQGPLSPRRKGGGSIFGDYDNDGDLDLFVPIGAQNADDAGMNLLLRNDQGMFHDVALKAGLTDALPTDNALWLDYDRDGYLDLYTGNLAATTTGGDPTVRNKLYRNQGDGTFADVTEAAGLKVPLQPIYGGSNGGMAAVAVVNTSDLEINSNEWTARPMQLPAVQIQRLDCDSRTATAALQWSPYQGGKFAVCQVRRRTEELATQVLFETRDRAVTSFMDRDLVGATDYYYQVVVLTDRGEEVPSAERRGAIHPAQDSWPLKMEEGTRVRLYREPGDRIAALIADGHRVRLRSFTTEGQFLEEQVLLDLPKLWGDLSPRFMDTALGPDGQRFLSLVSTSIGGFILGILSWGGDLPERILEIDDLPGDQSGAGGVVLGQLSLEGTFDHVSLSAGGRRLWTEDFSAFPEGEVAGVQQEWEFRGKAKIQNGWLFGSAATRHSAESWREFRVEADVVNSSTFSQAVIQAGGDSLSRFVLRLEQSNQRAVLEWGFSPPGQSNLAPRISVVRPCTLMVGIPYHLSLEVAGGQVRAAVQSRVLWSKVPKKGAIWTSLNAVEDALLLTVNNQPYTISLQGEAKEQPALDAKVSEVRDWEDSLGVPWIGICLPEVNQIKLGSFPQGLPDTWSSFLIAPPLGPSAGSEAGFMSYPLSFDVGPDGRVFVLDAGNSRILVFDPERRYLTQWGRKGSGAGEFDFGEGRNKGDELDLAGSVVVDSEGYIYVADVVNQRIQRFAP